MKNYGVILGQRPEDYVVGASPIPYEVRNPSADWRPYLPSEERQYSRNADSMACVSFSALNCVEMQIRMLTGVQTNLSDRWLAKMSNTTPDGNYLWRVGDTLRKFGCAEERYWPAPANFTWDQYYTEIPVNVQNEGIKLLGSWDIRYEWIEDLSIDSLNAQLKQSPLQVVIPGHAVCLVACEADLQHYFDSYEPYLKEYGSPFQAAFKYVVSRKNMDKVEVEALQLLEGYDDAGGQDYWGDGAKSLKQYLVARIEDKIRQLTEVLAKLKA